MTQAVFPAIQVYLDTTSTPLSTTDLTNNSGAALLNGTGAPRIDTMQGDCLVSFQTSRGRQDAQSHFDSGSLTIQLNNRTGWLDPTNPNGPFYPNLGVGNRISLYAIGQFNTYALYSGYVNSMTPSYDWTGDETMTLVANDMFNLLALQTWALRTSFAPSTADAVITGILSDLGFATAWKIGDTGLSLCQPPLDDGSGQTANALDVMQQAAEDTEAGLLFVTASGFLNFWNRYKRPNNIGASTITLDDATSATYSYEPGLSIVTDDSRIVNGMTVTDALNTTATYSDSTSINKYGPRFNTLSTLGADPNAGYDLAAWTVQSQKDARQRTDQVTVRPVTTSLADWDTILTLDDFGTDGVHLKRTTPSGNAINQLHWLERVEHSYDGNEWVTTLGLTGQAATDPTAGWLKLGDATTGKLDTGTLGF